MCHRDKKPRTPVAKDKQWRNVEVTHENFKVNWDWIDRPQVRWIIDKIESFFISVGFDFVLLASSAPNNIILIILFHLVLWRL